MERIQQWRIHEKLSILEGVDSVDIKKVEYRKDKEPREKNREENGVSF